MNHSKYEKCEKYLILLLLLLISIFINKNNFLIEA